MGVYARVCVCVRVLYLTVYLLVCVFFFFCKVNAPSLYCSAFFFCFTPLVTLFFTQLLLKTQPWRLSQLFFFFLSPLFEVLTTGSDFSLKNRRD